MLRPKGKSRGSSPRVRGAPCGLPGCAPVVGLIPARAGSALSSRSRVRCAGAHPRACGERAGPPERRSGPAGSSPRVRGALVPGAHDHSLTGLIPARAGSTTTTRSTTSAHGAHPRACGERWIAALAAVLTQGSSPRVRGALHEPFPDPLRFGLIPARAGSAQWGSSSTPRIGAHPRACGERAGVLQRVAHPQGSSPRVWGAPVRAGADADRVRLIPARAGSAAISAVRASARPGSSPRVRGARPDRRLRRRRTGLIPARAGSATVF